MKTTEKVINKLFWIMKNQYGSYWVTLIGDNVPEEKTVWLKALKRYSAEDIGKAIRSVKQVYPKRPPDLKQFVALVRDLKCCRVGHLSNHHTYQSLNVVRAKESTRNDSMKQIMESISQ